MNDSVEDVEMAEVDIKSSETPHGTINYKNYFNNNNNNININNNNKNINNNNGTSLHGSFDSMDSGYLSFTASTGATVIKSTGRSRPSVKKSSYWLRSDQWQSERRKSSKFNSLINGSRDSVLESEDSIEDHNNSIESISKDRNHFRTDLRNYRLRTRNSGRSSNQWHAVTPAAAVSKVNQLTPITPLSPCTATTSYMACEPVEDVDKILSIPQSTPYICNDKLTESLTPTRTSSSFSSLSAQPMITFSPKTRKVSPVITSAENKKFSKLKIGNLNKIIKHQQPILAVKPKKLDFDKRVGCTNCKLATTRADYTGRETVDILSLLGEKSNHWRTIAKILSYLTPQDLCSVSMVSHVWRKICLNDNNANRRRLHHVYVRQNTKENLILIKSKCEITSTPKTSKLVKRNYLTDVQNMQATPGRRAPPQSPPVSPSKIKFHSFVKASRTLAPTERLCRCPKCSFASHVDDKRNVGTCTREGCSAEFCTLCSSSPHTGPCKTPLLATPTKRKKAPLIVGSKQSKRNLRRL
ncbi:F-box only protein 5-A [Microplitis demolitor]|uniref:F-box only protein 5-A n=1 Tax=Microplitis demolitor TaxID=69319 RepID=UPI0004CD53F8|nr:F-box only protein 5-A [Microplitis demolitor]